MRGALLASIVGGFGIYTFCNPQENKSQNVQTVEDMLPKEKPQIDIAGLSSKADKSLMSNQASPISQPQTTDVAADLEKLLEEAIPLEPAAENQ